MSSFTPGTDFVTDTMALILRIEGRKLGPTAKASFESMEMGGTSIVVPALVLAEVLYLSEKKRIKATLVDVADYLNRFPHCQEYPLNFAVVQTAALIDDIRELHDRLIAATARYLQLTLITNDPVIVASKWVNTAWK